MLALPPPAPPAHVVSARTSRIAPLEGKKRKKRKKRGEAGRAVSRWRASCPFWVSSSLPAHESVEGLRNGRAVDAA